MPLSDTGQRDPSMLGTSGYSRNALDFYPTPKRTVQSLLDIVGEDLPSWAVWEPFCGNGAFSSVISADARDCVSTDIRAYEGFDPDGLFDFFAIVPDDEYDAAVAKYPKRLERWEAEVAKFPAVLAAWEAKAKAKKQKNKNPGEPPAPPMKPSHPVRFSEIAALKGFTPDCIITNPPYGKEAEEAARHALKLMKPQKGIVIFLCRHEWDAAKSRRDLFDHPAFAMKITLRHRPRWIEGSEGAPRFPYSYYVWDWSKPAHVRPEIAYAA